MPPSTTVTPPPGITVGPKPSAASAAPAGAASGSVSAPGAASNAAGPRIVSVATTPNVVHNGDVVRWIVHTSPDVVAVSAHVMTYSFALQKRAPGTFALAFTIPKGVPFFFHHTYTLAVTARNAAGATTTANVGIPFQ